MLSRQLCTIRLSLVAAVIFVPSSKADEQTKDRRNVAIVVHDGVELLDLAGPGEVFSAANGGRAFRVFTVSETDKPIKSQRFLTVTPEFTIANCPKPDIIVIPGGATGVLLRSPAVMKWIRERAPETEVMFSVCTGAFVLADAGLLDGLEATTHHGSIAGLKRYPKIKVLEDRRVVDNGKIVTAAGVSAGIDGALHLVARLCGKETADRTAKYMEYRWQPETTKSTRSDSLYESAKTLAKAGQKAEALANFEKAITANAADIERALTEADFENLRSEPRFRNLFRTHARSRARLTPAHEPGDALVVSGVVRGADAQPIANAIVYVYHTDHRGYYSRQQAMRDAAPRLFAYLKTDDQGRYEFRTIRPGGYPDSQVPQHIHYEVTFRGKPVMVTEFFFPDDPRMKPSDRERAAQRKMLATISRDADGTQRARFDVVMESR
jgi:transcriptional regulator GlxA family with amidase domain